MTRLRVALLVGLCLGLFDACTPPAQKARPEVTPAFAAAAAVGPSNCHVTPDGRPDELAERGIGGTGGTAPPPPGAPPPSLGVAGIINGFGSVCLNDLEVGLLPGTTVTVDGAPARADDLRIGQQAVLSVAWRRNLPVTDHLAIRHAVIGPVEQANAGRSLVVAGQRVWLSKATWLNADVRPGRWVAVSGLVTPAGEILASRIDPASGGTILVHGKLQGKRNDPRIGMLSVRLSDSGAAGKLPPGAAVVATGFEAGGRVTVSTLQPDLLASNPQAVFGHQVHHFLIQSLTGSGPQAVSSLNLSGTFPPGSVLTPNNVPTAVNMGLDPSGVSAAVLGGLRHNQAGAVSPSPPSSSGPSPGSHGPSAPPGGHGPP